MPRESFKLKRTNAAGSSSLVRVPGIELPRLPREWPTRSGPGLSAGPEQPAADPERTAQVMREWQTARDRLAAACSELSEELDSIAKLPGFSIGVSLRSLFRRLRGVSHRSLGVSGPRHTARLGGTLTRDTESLTELIDRVRQLHTDFEQLRARINHPGVRAFRWLRRAADRIPGADARREQRIRAVRRRLISRPLPKALPRLPMQRCPDLISIVLPTYNRADTLERAIASVRQQSYPNWELIVVDDGSTDSTRELAADHRGGHDDPRIHWLHLPHRGVSAARNAGIARARGKWVAFLDSDNVWYADFLEQHQRLLAASPQDIVGSYSDQFWFHGDRRRRRVAKQFTPAELFHLPQIDLNALTVRRTTLERVGGFDEAMTKWVDYELMLRLSAVGKFVHLPRVLGEYYRLEDGISRMSERQRPLGPNLARVRQIRADLLRVGYVLWDYPAASQAFVHRELRSLRERGIDVHVYYATPAETAAKKPPEVPSFRVASARELAELALAHERNILHGHFAYPTTTVHLWPAAERAKIPFTFTAHGVDLFHQNNQRRHRVGRIGSSSYCKAAFAIGSFHARYLERNGVPSAAITPIRCAVDPEWFTPLPDFERRLERIALVSRFVPKKGILDFIEIARALSDEKLSFELHGFGPLEAEIRAAARGLDNLQVHVGAVSETDVRRICDRASAILLPCRRAPDGDMDGLPVILLEGAARGCLLLSSRVSSIPDLVENDRSGFLLEPGDVAGYTAALLRARAASGPELAGLRRNAYAQVVQEFETSRITKTLIEAWCR